MTKDEVIKTREVLNKIKVTMSDNKKHAVCFIIQTDDAYFDESHQAIFWDDDDSLLLFYSYNQFKIGASPYMIGRDKISVPAMLTAVPYEIISSISIKLTKDAMEESFKALEGLGVKYRNNDGELTALDDKKKKALLKFFIEQTDPSRDPNFRVTTEYPYK